MSYTAEQQKANRDKWITALRSGEFTQGQAALRSRDAEYCCLGVACELASRDGVISPWTTETGYDGEAMTPSSKVMHWLGLADDCGETRKPHLAGAYSDGEPKEVGALTELNDSGDWTFEQIADLIEQDGVNLSVQP